MFYNISLHASKERLFAQQGVRLTANKINETSTSTVSTLNRRVETLHTTSLQGG